MTDYMTKEWRPRLQTNEEIREYCHIIQQLVVIGEHVQTLSEEEKDRNTLGFEWNGEFYYY